MTDKKFIFLLIGKTGNGKSSTGNSILGFNAFQSSDSNESTTNQISIKSKDRGRYHVTVVDTPGFMDTNVDENEAKSKACKDMKKAMEECPTNGTLTIILVLRYGDKGTCEYKLSSHILKQIFGEEYLCKSCIIVLTYGDAYNTKYKGKKCFKEWMGEQKGDLGVLLKMCGYRCMLFCNETDQAEMQDKQFETLIEVVKTIDQSYTLNQFESAKKRQARLQLEAELPKLEEHYDEEIEIMQKEIKNISDGPQTIKALDEMDTAVTKLLNHVNGKDSPQVIFYAHGELRLLEKTRSSLNEMKKHIFKMKDAVNQMVIAGELKKKNVHIQDKIKGANANEIQIKSILSVIRKDLGSLDLTKLNGTIRTEMDKAVEKTTEKLNKLEYRVTVFLNLKNNIQVFTDKCNGLRIPCRLSQFKELHADCDKLFQEVENCINNNEDRLVLTKMMDVIKNVMIEKKKENEMFIAGELKKRNVNIQNKIKGINANEIQIQNILSIIRNEIESLDLTQLDGAIRTEMDTAVYTTTQILHQVEERVTLFLNLENNIQVLTNKYNALSKPCFVHRFTELHTDCDKLFQDVTTGVSNNEDRAVLTKRLEVIKQAIIHKKKENDKSIAAISFSVVPFGGIVTMGLVAAAEDTFVVKHDKKKELEESALRKLHSK